MSSGQQPPDSRRWSSPPPANRGERLLLGGLTRTKRGRGGGGGVEGPSWIPAPPLPSSPSPAWRGQTRRAQAAGPRLPFLDLSTPLKATQMSLNSKISPQARGPPVLDSLWPTSLSEPPTPSRGRFLTLSGFSLLLPLPMPCQGVGAFPNPVTTLAKSFHGSPLLWVLNELGPRS